MIPVYLLRSSRHLGGVERQLLDHALRLRDAAWQPHLLCLYRAGGEHPLVVVARQHGLPATTVPDPSPWHPGAWRQLRRLPAPRPAGILHTCDYRSDTLAWALRRPWPQVAESHGHTAESLRMRVWNRLDSWGLRRMAAVAAVSPAWAQTLRQQGIAAGRCHVIGNSRAILPATSPPPPAALPAPGPHMLFAGRLSPEKGLHVLLAAWPTLRQHFPHAHLWVLGPTPASTYRRRIRPHLRQPGIHLLGYQADIRPWLHAVDAVIIPSLDEAWGMTAFEGLSMGARVLTTRVGGLPLLCRSAPHAHLVPAGSPAALIAGVQHILAPDFPHGPELGRQYCARPAFDPGRRFAEWLRIYESVLP